MTIECDSVESMVEVVAGLVEKGLTFEVTESYSGCWKIELTGGY